MIQENAIPWTTYWWSLTNTNVIIHSVGKKKTYKNKQNLHWELYCPVVLLCVDKKEMKAVILKAWRETALDNIDITLHIHTPL